MPSEQTDERYGVGGRMWFFKKKHSHTVSCLTFCSLMCFPGEEDDESVGR